MIRIGRLGTFVARFTPSLAVVSLTLALPGMAQAQYRQETAGRVGSGVIIRIFDGARFDRCSAEFFDSNRNALRIAFNTQRQYALSIPQIVVQPGQRLTIAVSSTGSATYTAGAAGNQGGRAWRMLDQQVVERMMDFRGPLLVQAAATRYHWNLGTSVENMLVAIENCTNRASGWR